MIEDYTSIDIETTGLYEKRDKIIEVGAVRVRNGKITASFESLINPGRLLEEKIIELTGITDEELKNAPEASEVIPELLAFIGEDILLGHSVLFDYSFIKQAAVNQGLVFEKQGIDTLKLARRFLPELESRRLPFLCSHYGIPHKAHRGLADAKATVFLYKKLAEEFYEEEAFLPFPLLHMVKKEVPASKRQKDRLYKLAEKHKLEIDYDIDKLTRNEADRRADKIILQFGRQ